MTKQEKKIELAKKAMAELADEEYTAPGEVPKKEEKSLAVEAGDSEDENKIDNEEEGG